MPAASQDGAATLSSAPPALDAGEASAVAARLFGVDAAATLLASERDQNFRLDGGAGESWLLKVSNPSEPADIVDLQVAALDHIHARAPGAPVPRVLRNRHGDATAAIRLPDGRRTCVRLLTYLEGLPVRGTPRTRAQRVSLGRALAGLDRALDGFSHPAASHDLMWNVAHADRLAGMIDQVATGARAAMLHAFMNRFRAVQPQLARLRRQVIHNDYHLFNVLVAHDDDTRVTGIIDFGDLIEAPLVGEVATGAAYQLRGTDDPLGAVAEFVAAYHAVLPLDAGEREIVAELMATRHLVTVLITEWRVKRYPENRDYILRHNPESWDALFLMADMGSAALRDRVLSGIDTGDLR
ncbi:MAG: phosphotransferase [Sphingomonas adhaesiva]|uniref:phosphotransferase n=1 Tax=Sphingomonas adhaesiva TaxID=28212 RepID=UPI002FF7D3F0